jgi:hypothetical protein
MKHRNLNRSTCHLPGFEEKQPPKNNKGGGYPNRQVFSDHLRYVTKKGKKHG